MNLAQSSLLQVFLAQNCLGICKMHYEGKKKSLLVNVSKHSPECFLLCLNRLSVTKKNKHAAGPQILCNSSWWCPWNLNKPLPPMKRPPIHAFSKETKMKPDCKLNVKQWLFEMHDYTAPCRTVNTKWCWNEHVKNWEAVYFTDIYRD